MEKSYKIAVLDDHDLINEAIKSMLEKNKKYQFVAGFVDALECIQYLNASNNVDVLLLDIHLNGEDGLKICNMLTQKYPSLYKIMLTSLTQQSIVTEALKNGARGYLPKNVSYQELIEAFETVVCDKIYLHKNISFLPVKNEKAFSYQYVPKLTRREKEILQLILEEFTTQEIADKLFITVSTVETHRSSLLTKTGSKNVVGLIKHTIEKGLLSS